MILFAKTALLPEGWASDVRIRVTGGRIVEVTPGAVPERASYGCLLPAPVNLHSHTFQRAMAGMTEGRTVGQDSFWTWRALMYRFLDRLTPEDMQTIAAQAMVEMAEAGFAALCEFHYLHHPPGGGTYADPAEMSARIVAAAAETGLGLTHLPVIYEQGGVDGRALAGGQLRFGSSPDTYSRLLDGAGRATAALPDACLGVAPHSLRAVSRTTLAQVAGLLPNGPVHIHIAEQEAEVAQCIAHTGRRPVAYLLDQLALDERWCLVHATHLDAAEVTELAASGAVAGLCPTTEANLGDGLFPLAPYIAAGGRFGIGSDSHVSQSPVEELRWLEYGQRLQHRQRNVAHVPAQRSVGDFLWQAALTGGAQATGRRVGALAAGRRADLLVLDAQHPNLDGVDHAEVLGRMVFCGNDNLVRDVLCGGRWVVQSGRHRAQEAIASRYCQALRDLRS